MATTKALITVTLASGVPRQHEFDVSTNEVQMLAWVMFYTTQLTEVFHRKTTNVFIVLNPLTVYNANQIASVSIEFSEGEQYNKLVQEHSTGELGFRPGTQSIER